MDSTGAADVDEPRDPARWAGAVVQPAAAIVGDAWQGRDTAALHAERRLLLGKRSGDAARRLPGLPCLCQAPRKGIRELPIIGFETTF